MQPFRVLGKCLLGGLVLAVFGLAVSNGSFTHLFGDPHIASAKPAPAMQQVAQAAPSSPQALTQALRPPPRQVAQAAPSSPQAPAKPQAPPPPPQPDRTEILRFANWTVTCLYYSAGPKKRVCAARLQVESNNQVVLSWVVSVNNSRQFVTALQVPTGVAIPPGVEIEFDKKAKRTLGFASCGTGNCTATAVMDATFIRQLETAQKVQISLQAESGRVLQFDIPATGFEKAYAQVRAAI